MLVGDKGMNASVERCVILTLGLIMYTRRQKGDISVLCCSIKMEMHARSIEQKMEIEQELSTVTNSANDYMNCS